MGKTSIEWTDHSINPIRARLNGRTGHYCEKVSAGCKFCYSSRLQKRFGMPEFQEQRNNQVEVFFDQSKLLEVVHRKKPTRYFWENMSDLFATWVPDAWIDQCIGTMAWSRQHTHMILTKRADRMFDYCRGLEKLNRHERGIRMARSQGWNIPEDTPGGMDWPLPNVYLGVSAENHPTLQHRVPYLQKTMAAVRFISYEPALGPINLNEFTGNYEDLERVRSFERLIDGISWIIIGGESGPGARPFDLAWARSTIEQCREAGVAVFYKQGGSSNRCEHDGKGGHFECIPNDLQIREFPNA